MRDPLKARPMGERAVATITASFGLSAAMGPMLPTSTPQESIMTLTALFCADHEVNVMIGAKEGGDVVIDAGVSP